jgi:A/G-specific adenine glycosylase
MLTLDQFKELIWHFYQHNKRDFPWRNIDNAYHVVVSEIMLQQTQTHRVISKYEEFISTFAHFESLANAELRDVLSVWQGLGYYRRARFLHQMSQKIINEYGGILPQDPKILQTFSGIGPHTAASICAFAFNLPTVFIETNIRTVFIHHFFHDKVDVTDKEIMPLITATVDRNNPREWYYALMDYGVFLKSNVANPSRKSAHYTKQSKFEGSNRQLRAKILKFIVAKGSASYADIRTSVPQNEERVDTIMHQLLVEEFIKKAEDDVYYV